MGFISVSWEENGQLYGRYSHSGEILERTEPPAMYGGSIGYFITSDPQAGRKLYENKLKFLYNPDIGSWKSDLSYYDSNWAWFGVALYNDLLPNLAAQIPDEVLAGDGTAPTPDDSVNEN